MKRATVILAAVFLFCVTGTALGYTLLDLTQKVENGMPAWDGKWEGMIMWGGAKAQAQAYDIGGDFYGHDLKFTEHTGTHMDSPAHQASGLWRLDQIPQDKFHGKTVIMDMRPWVKDRDAYEVTLADVRAWERKTGVDLAKAGAHSIVFMWTGWDKYWDEYLAGKSERFVKYGFPGITEEVAAYLADARIKGFGMDVLSIDIYRRVVDEGKPKAHQALFRNNVWVIENIRFDPSVADKWVYAVVAPMKIYQGSGAPTRIFVLDDRGAATAPASLASMSALEQKFRAAPMFDLANDLRNGMHIWETVLGGTLLGAGGLNDFRGIYPASAYQAQYDGWYFQQLYINEHTGTHTDAPAHRREGAQWTLDKIPLKHFAAPLVVVNASRYGREAGDWDFDMVMFRDWMAKHPELTINKGDLVCFSQDMVHKWALHNNGVRREWVTYTFPGIGGDVAAYLSERGVVGVLTDVTSIDPGMRAQRGKGTGAEKNVTHVTLLGKGIFVTENVGGDLQQAANSKGLAFVMPAMNTKNGSGGHSRIWYFEGLDIPIE